MGEVYRARYTKLNRDVAIKVLPAARAHDPERLARFEPSGRRTAYSDKWTLSDSRGSKDLLFGAQVERLSYHVANERMRF